MSEEKILGYFEVSGRIRDGHTPRPEVQHRASYRRKIVIGPEGDITSLYDDGLVGLGEIQAVKHASHVDWSDGRGFAPKGWYVRLSLDARNGQHSGELIGSGFATRAEALAFEVAWLQENTLK